MDKHLNLFYSYNQGELQNPATENQLENNLTRALIVTLKNLSKPTRNLLIEKILYTDPEQHIKSNDFTFDLQNTEIKRDKESYKYLVILQRKRSQIKVEDLKNLNQSLFRYFTDENSASDIQKQIRQSTKEERAFVKDGSTINYEELNSIFELTKGNIPDAWIIGEKETILLETKIGNNTASPYQIFRHITGENGFGITYKEFLSGQSELKLVNISWGELCNFIKDIQPQDQLGNDKLLLNELLEYIIMTAQVLDFSYITSNNIDPILHKNQFELFLDRFDSELIKANLDIPLERKKRKKSGLWEPYTIKGSLDEDPHFTISFSDKEMSIALTTKNMTQVKKVISSIEEFYVTKRNNPDATIFRYYISQEQYKLVDWKPGQLHGEHESLFNFYIFFSEIKENISRVCKIIKEFTDLKLYKQFELGYSIQFYDFSKVDKKRDGFQVRNTNIQLLDNPDQIVRIFIDFIKETLHMYKIMDRAKN